MSTTITEEAIEPWIEFSSPLDLLIQRNEKMKAQFRDNPLFRLMESGKINSEEKRKRFLLYFKIWSQAFQKAMLIKTAFCDDSTFIPVFNQHFQEELGHDRMLSQQVSLTSIKKDAVLEALCTWFPSKMISFDRYEQIVVMNLCVEASALVFYEYAKPSIDPKNKLIHFQAHGEIDICHEKLGLDLLEGLKDQQYKRLFEVQEETWAMLEALMKRLGELTLQP